jgi:multisubunit Na+/H+ antiporter MnhC subunit
MSPEELHILGRVFYAGALGLLLLGLYAVAARRDLIRVLLGVALLQAGANLLLVAVGFRPDAAAPILVDGVAGSMVDPIPQALILTTIVIGVGVLALGLALAVRLHETTGTLDAGRALRVIEAEGDGAAEGAGGALQPRGGERR